LRNKRIHPLSSPAPAGREEFCAERNTRSGCGITIVTRPSADVVTATATPSTLGEDDQVDQFTISFESTDSGADMILRWVDTEVRVPIALP
jgi:hypothetical protein